MTNKPWARLLAAILAVQAAYWLIIYPILDAPSLPDSLFELGEVQAARIDSPDAAGLAKAKFGPAELMWTGCCDPAYYAVRINVNIDRDLPDGAGMTPSVQADNVRVFVNGKLAVSQGRMELPKPTIERLRSIWFLPPGLLKRGTNTIEIVTVRASYPYTDVNPPRIGPWPDMQKAFAFRQFQFNEYGWISLTINALIALAAGVLFWRGGRSPAYFWLGLLAASWSFYLFLPFWSDPPFSGEVRTLLIISMQMIIPLAWAGFANEWGGKPVKWLRWIMPLAGALAVGLVAMAPFLLGLPESADQADQIVMWTLLVFSGLTIALLLRRAILVGADHPLETALFLLLAVLMGFHGLTRMQVYSFVDGLEFTAPMILVALAITFLSRNLHLFRSMTEFNQLLSAQLAAREQEIADSYAQRQEVERQGALLEERQRIMRDMHDGMGGRLMSLAAQLRGGSDPVRQEAADDILGALDELRLIVDSLDTAGDDLGMALGAFRARMEAKLTTAGIALDWAIDGDAAQRTLSATAILDIYRILQEACSNVLRHAEANRIEISLRKSTDGIELVIADNGKGLSESASDAGHGLANMRRRAAAIGGTIAFADNAPGLRISLTLPSPQPSPA